MRNSPMRILALKATPRRFADRAKARGAEVDSIDWNGTSFYNVLAGQTERPVIPATTFKRPSV